ncbi:MAG: LysM peptidoglycan-binding domain-containing protein [Myxococcales bacterium]|nr:LysM peptidoglycan-binding domain-containing protein [Myxococcales bacterium]
MIDNGHLNRSGAQAFIETLRIENDKVSAKGAPKPFQTHEMSTKAGPLTLNKTSLRVVIKRKLNEKELQGVALYLFQQQSVEFESEQAQSWTRASGSGFSGEDMPSNLLSFYRAARDQDADTVFQACGEDVLRRTDDKPDLGVNKTFRPLGLEPSVPFPPRSLGHIDPIPPGDLYELQSVSRGNSDGTPLSLDGIVPATHVVAPGDTLWEIAMEKLGDGILWKDLATRNGIEDPAALRPGMVLELPAKRNPAAG